MENDQDIKDLLIIVHDKSNVTPVGADHPLMSNLFSNERSKLAEMQSQLDSMLMSWMGKKNSSLLSATSWKRAPFKPKVSFTPMELDDPFVQLSLRGMSEQ
jgi:hypothetical protein